MGACVAYSTAEEVAWPMSWEYMHGEGGRPASGRITSAAAARLATARALEILAVATSDILPNSLFKCPQCRFPGPRLKAAHSAANGYRWGADVANAVSYAFDWASPADPSSARVVFADRDPQNHNGAVMACFGDSHVKKLKVIPGTSVGTATENSDGSPIRAIIADPGIDAGQPGFPGNIFSPEGDQDPEKSYEPFTPAGGHPMRAWVK